MTRKTTLYIKAFLVMALNIAFIAFLIWAFTSAPKSELITESDGHQYIHTYYDVVHAQGCNHKSHK